MLTYLPEDLNVKVDRATMANSLEARSPLLDHRVYEFAAALPSHRKMRRGTSKIVLREVAKQLMPAELRRPAQDGLRRAHRLAGSGPRWAMCSATRSWRPIRGPATSST